MNNSLLLGVARLLVPLPRPLWQRDVARQGRRFTTGRQNLPETHRRVHHFVVRELPRYGIPLSPTFIADQLDMPLDQVQHILADLEKQKTWLFRNVQGDVTWAYPVTSEQTPHRVTFSSGEQIFAA